MYSLEQGPGTPQSSKNGSNDVVILHASRNVSIRGIAYMYNQIHPALLHHWYGEDVQSSIYRLPSA